MKGNSIVKKRKIDQKNIKGFDPELHNLDSLRDKWSLNLLTSLQKTGKGHEQRIRKPKK